MRQADPTLVDAMILALVDKHPGDLVVSVATELGLSRPTVIKRVKALVDGQYLVRTGGRTRPVYRKGTSRRELFEYRLEGLAEDRVWIHDVAPLLAGLSPNVIDIAHHGVTEMVNNAVDHSGGEHVEVFVQRSEHELVIRVRDDGIGIFRKITRALDLPDERLALLELSKGKFTTDPSRHSGEGIFFTSRMFDSFYIRSARLAFSHNDGDRDLLYEREADGDEPTTGTVVYMYINVDSQREIAEIFNEYSSGPDDYSFAKTVVPVKLARIEGEGLVSRSQAKRLMLRVDRFQTVMLDFEGVERIGQAFADEVFRVFANAHPDVELIACHASPEVQQMIRRAEVLRDEEMTRRDASS